METNYTRRRRGGQFSDTGASRYAALTQLEKRDDETIRGMERQAQSAKEVAKNWGDAYERAKGREVAWLASLQVDEDKIHTNKIRANKIRSDREVEALLEKSKFYEKESAIWSTFTSSFGGELAKAGVKAFEAYQTAQARKNYKMPDFTAGYAFAAEVNADEQTKYINKTLNDLLNNKTLTVQEKAATLKVVTNESSLIQEGFFSQDWIDNLDVIISSTKRDAGKLYNSTNVKELLELRAHLYLQGNQIDATSKAGLEILQKTNIIASLEKTRLELSSKGRVDHAELTAGAKAVRVAYKSKKPDRIQSTVNALVVEARGSVIKTADGKWVDYGTHNMNLPEAMEHILPYIKRAHPDMTWADVEKILGKAKVPLAGNYEHLDVSDEKLNKVLEKAEKITGDKFTPEQDAKFRKDYKQIEADKAPTWAEALKNRGYTEIAKKSWLSEEEKLDNLNKKTADSEAVTEKANWVGRFNNKDSVDAKGKSNYIDLNVSESFIKNTQTGKSKRDEIYDIASAKSTHPIVSKYLFQQLDWDSNRQSTFAAEERYKAAVATGGFDDDTYMFNKLSKEAQEHYLPKHISMKELFASTKDINTEVGTAVEGFIGAVYRDAYEGGKLTPEAEKIKDLGKQSFFHFVHRFGDKKNPAYINNIEGRKQEALKMVKIDIQEGNGVFSRTEAGEGVNLKVTWHAINYPHSKNKEDKKEAAKFIESFKVYNPKTVKDILTKSEQIQLMESAIQGNVHDLDLPENLLNVFGRIKIDPTRKTKEHPNGVPLTLRRIINDILIVTPIEFDKKKKPISGHEDMEYEWPAGMDDFISEQSDQAFDFTRNDGFKISAVLNFQSTFGVPLMSDKMKASLEGYIEKLQNKRYVTWP